MPQELSFIVPEVPPSVNHYKVPKIIKPHGRSRHAIMWLETAESQLFKLLIREASEFKTIAPNTQRERDLVRYELNVKVVLGRAQRGDGDNFWKVIADGLVQCGVIHSDARVKRWILEVDDTDRSNPRTEITARVIGYKNR